MSISLHLVCAQAWGRFDGRPNKTPTWGLSWSPQHLHQRVSWLLNFCVSSVFPPVGPMANQNKPCCVFFPNPPPLPWLMNEVFLAPLDLVEKHIWRFYTQGVSYAKMVPLLWKHYDMNSYGLGYNSFFSHHFQHVVSRISRKTRLKMYAKSLGLKSTHSQGHTFGTIAHPIAKLREKYPKAGAELLHVCLRSDFEIRVSR